MLSSHSQGVTLTITGPIIVLAPVSPAVDQLSGLYEIFSGRQVPPLANWHQALIFSFSQVVNPKEIPVSWGPLF